MLSLDGPAFGKIRRRSSGRRSEEPFRHRSGKMYIRRCRSSRRPNPDSNRYCSVHSLA